MSQHPSLRSSDKNRQHRSVLKRHERISMLQSKEKWAKEDSVYGLPKVKIVRFKVKKEKAAAATAEGAEGAAAAPAAGAPAATPAQKGAPAQKAAPAKAPAGESKKEAKK